MSARHVDSTGLGLLYISSNAPLDAVAETLLTPLWARAHAREVAPELDFADPFARDLLERNGFEPDHVLTDHSNAAGSLHRTVIFDRITREFAGRHQDAVVVAAGCGLCARDRRLGPDLPPTVRWIAVDSEDVIAVRRDLVPDDPSDTVAADLGDPGWLRGLAVDDRPTLVLAEGVLMYLDDDGLDGFLTAVAGLTAGSEVVADVFHRRIALSGKHPIVKATGAEFRSGVRDSAELAGRVPGLEATGEHDVMERLGVAQRAAARAFRVATRGGRAYHVAQLRVTGMTEPGRPPPST